MKHLPEWTYGMRDWQKAADLQLINKFNDGVKEFLTVATPGAGKTTFGNKSAYRFLRTGIADRVVVAVPTENLKRQWATAAAKFGIYLDPEVSNSQGMETSDYHGMVATYAQIGMNPEIHNLQQG